jgi:hypothetical protein
MLNAKVVAVFLKPPRRASRSECDVISGEDIDKLASPESDETAWKRDKGWK